MGERTVSALYVDARGVYPGMPGVDAWDVSRDARGYAGPHPVVAHPPCGHWGALRALARQPDRDCAPLAVAAVRAWGGVLEHPAYSRLWQTDLGLPRPGELPDAAGGFTVEVDQVAWGHVARKRTWLYIVGVDRATVAREVCCGGVPTHWVCGSRRRSAKMTGGLIPAGIKVCSAQQRRRTPRAFAEWLVSLARRSRIQ